MVVFANLETFKEAVKLLFIRNPRQARLCSKTRTEDKLIEFSASDNEQKLRYITGDSTELSQLQRLVSHFILWSVRKELKTVEDLERLTGGAVVTASSSAVPAAAAVVDASTPTTAAGGPTSSTKVTATTTTKATHSEGHKGKRRR